MRTTKVLLTPQTTPEDSIVKIYARLTSRAVGILSEAPGFLFTAPVSGWRI